MDYRNMAAFCLIALAVSAVVAPAVAQCGPFGFGGPFGVPVPPVPPIPFGFGFGLGMLGFQIGMLGFGLGCLGVPGLGMFGGFGPFC